MCLEIKNKRFPAGHLAKFASIQKLHEKSISLKVTESFYEWFIINELTNNTGEFVSEIDI